MAEDPSNTTMDSNVHPSATTSALPMAQPIETPEEHGNGTVLPMISTTATITGRVETVLLRERAANKRLTGRINELTRQLAARDESPTRGAVWKVTESQQLQQAFKQRDSYKRQVENMRKMLDLSRPEKTVELQDAVQALNEDIKKYKDEIKSLKNVQRLQEKRLTGAQSEHELSERMSALSAQITSLKKGNRDLREQLTVAERSLRTNAAENTKVHHTCDQLAAQNKKLKDKTQPNVGDDKADKTTENTVAETTQAVAVVETVAETALAETPSGLGQASDLPPESSVQVVAGSSDVVAAPVESNTAESNPTAANTATEPAANVAPEPQPVANVATEAAATTVHEAAGGETGEAGAGGVVPHPPEAHNERPAVPPMKLDLVRRRRRHSSSSSNTGPTVPAPT